MSPARLHVRLTVCLSTVAATAALGAVLAPAASAAEAAPPPTLPGKVATCSGVAPSVIAAVLPFGRKLV